MALIEQLNSSLKSRWAMSERQPPPSQTADEAADEALRVAYILKQYPRLSETFILNEILGLEATGVDVSIYSLRNATEGRFHPGIASVKAGVRYASAGDKTHFLEALQALPNLRVEQLPAVFAFLDQLPADRRPLMALQAIEIAKQVDVERVDHIHSHFMTVAAHTAHLVSLLTGIPFSVTAHAKDVYRRTINWDVASEVAGRAAAVITVCDANLNYLSHRLDGAGARLVRIYNGLGPQEPTTPTRNRTPGLIVGVGRLVSKKGFDLLIDAAADLTGHHPDLHCVLIGDGDQREALKAQVDRLDLAATVTFAGALPQDQVAAWLRRAQLMVAPCRVGPDGNQDALPTVLLEALGAGLPAITTPVAGIPEIITDGVEGRIVACEDIGALTAAISELLDDDQARDAMAAAGPTKLARVFDRTETIEQLIDTFKGPAVVEVAAS